MVDQKQGVASKGEKAGESVALDPNASAVVPAANVTTRDTAAKAEPATPTKMELATEIYWIEYARTLSHRTTPPRLRTDTRPGEEWERASGWGAMSRVRSRFRAPCVGHQRRGAASAVFSDSV